MMKRTIISMQNFGQLETYEPIGLLYEGQLIPLDSETEDLDSDELSRVTVDSLYNNDPAHFIKGLYFIHWISNDEALVANYKLLKDDRVLCTTYSLKTIK